MPEYKEKKLEGTAESQPASKVDVFPDHLSTRIRDYKVRIDKNGVKARKEVNDMTVKLVRLDYNNWYPLLGPDVVDKKEIKVPSIEFVVSFSFTDLSRIAELRPDDLRRRYPEGTRQTWINVRVFAKFPIDGNEMEMKGVTKGIIKNSMPYRLETKESNLRDAITLDDEFRSKLAGDIRMLAKKVDWMLKFDPNASVSFKAIMAADKARIENFDREVESLTIQVLEISKKCDVFKNQDALLQVALKAREQENGEAIVLKVSVDLFMAAQFIQGEANKTTELSAKAFRENEAKKLFELSTLFHDYALKDLEEKREKESGKAKKDS
jgi:hypothetical protein